ncbi:MBL fold metallo-hydrolase [Solimonas sp. SE-A11]|uniref:MBL fold metallo-hydrolase n=1 Tax=Solimonas sp. SE-A11 TaxID=3054954 RepID=UPI00259C965C|nr:MBL fold metallo-hydrolase [Solimonas sp. SE-A11]MDM4772622.1 MBL fold metallo-hydrolase [Solimonas sp. SE-A11]
MLFRQFFDTASSTYTYLLASGRGREAVIIDPVKENVAQYLQAIEQLDLRLVRAIDTHTHADHVTGLGDLRDATSCVTLMGEQSKASCVSQQVRDGDTVRIEQLQLRSLYTPGHTDESFSFLIEAGGPGAVFTGDVLLIRGTGRTDFQGGDPGRSWDSIHDRLLSLDDDTLVYPAHDYRGWTVSTIGEERRFNPRLAGRSRDEYIALMRGLRLPDPRMMDIAIPANLACGKT